jgi:hypothetical protein
MHFADLMALAGIIKDALSRRRFAGIDMRGNPNIALTIKRRCARHEKK